MRWRLSEHARIEAGRRGIGVDAIAVALAQLPHAKMAGGVEVRQAVVAGYLVRVFVNTEADPAIVVTVYRTSKLAKYGAQT